MLHVYMLHEENVCKLLRFIIDNIKVFHLQS